MTEYNDLLAAVDALTKSQIEHMAQKDDNGKWLKTHTVEHPPLLVRLKQAVTPSTNTSAGSSALASTRNIIDSTAMFEYAKMSSAVGDWCRIYKVATTRDPVVDLRRWYIAYELNPSGTGWHERELRRWANVIRNIIDRPEQLTIDLPCPVCGSDTWVNPEGEQLRHPIVVTYRLNDEGAMTGERAACRSAALTSEGEIVACGAVWETLESIQELGEELSERHDKKMS